MRANQLSFCVHCLLPVVILVFAVGAFAADGTEKVLYSFGGPPGGATPEAGMILDAAGNLYGTTYYGGTSSECQGHPGGCGTIFELTANPDGTWAETVLHSFDLVDGAYPDRDLVFDTAGNLFGVTDVGRHVGLAYELMRISGGWSYNVVHAFAVSRQDGGSPRSVLLLDANGNLFGTTAGGGTGYNGTIYELSPGSGGTWTESILHNFGPGYAPSGGAEPDAGLISDAAGNLYGATAYGGNQACPQGCGTIFELSPNGDGTWKKRVLHKFNGSDGLLPYADLVADQSGNLYGTTDEGGKSGCYGGCGTLFKLTKTPSGGWKFSVLHVFEIGSGGGPESRLVVDSAGNLYGTTVVGGIIKACPVQRGCGVVFKLAPHKNGQWAYTVLHKFTNGQDGALAHGVVMDAAGNLYGTTIAGGADGLGTVFEVTP